MPAIKTNPMVLLIRELIKTPLAFGLVGLFLFYKENRFIREWFIILFVPLCVVTAVMILTLSVPGAAPWRISGPWVLLLVPFLAYAIDKLSNDAFFNKPNFLKLSSIVFFTLLCSISFYIASRNMSNNSFFSMDDLQSGLFIRDIISSNDKRVLLESDRGFRYLNVIVASNLPGRLILNTGDDPVAIALYIPNEKYYRKNDENIVQKYLSDKYGLDGDINVNSLTEKNIKYIMVRNNNYVQLMKKSIYFNEIKRFGRWILFELIENEAKP